MKITFMLLLTVSSMLVSIAVAQDNANSPSGAGLPGLAAPPRAQPMPAIPNPFESEPDSGGEMGMGPGMGMDMGMEGMDMGMDGMYGGMGMDEMDGGMGDMGSGMSADDLFRYRLRNAIAKIGSVKSDEEKAVLVHYTQTAFQERYDEMIVSRKKDLERLKQSLAKLESDLQRREAAKDRVIKLQMQSVILAAEGLLDLNSLQPTPPGGGGYGMEMGGYGGGMGSGN